MSAYESFDHLGKTVGHADGRQQADRADAADAPRLTSPPDA
jgi:hypothetical protein